MPSIGHFVWILIGSLRNLKSPFKGSILSTYPLAQAVHPLGRGMVVTRTAGGSAHLARRSGNGTFAK